jgi:hypothetical protein
MATPLLVLTLKVLVALPVVSGITITGFKVPNAGSSIVNLTLALFIGPNVKFDTITVMRVWSTPLAITQGLVVEIVEVSGRWPATIPTRDSKQIMIQIPAIVRIQITLAEMVTCITI